MLSPDEARTLIDDLFEEEVLAFGGLVAIHEVPDDLIWRLVKTLDTIRGRALRRIEAKAEVEAPFRAPDLRPHPAIEDFLLKLRRRPP